MWTRQRPEPHSEEEERQESEGLRSLLSGQGDGEKPEPAYWQRLIVETNRRIDEVSSAKALSISWVARVAIPGAVAILFFFIGLHYYVPERAPDQITVSEIVSTLSDKSLDSLVEHLQDRTTLASSGLIPYDEFLELSEDEMELYMAASGYTSVLLQNLPEEQVGELLLLLQPGKGTTLR